MTCTKCMFYNAGEGTDDMCSVCDENGSAFISAKQETQAASGDYEKLESEKP